MRKTKLNWNELKLVNCWIDLYLSDCLRCPFWTCWAILDLDFVSFYSVFGVCVFFFPFSVAVMLGSKLRTCFTCLLFNPLLNHICTKAHVVFKCFRFTTLLIFELLFLLIALFVACTFIYADAFTASNLPQVCVIGVDCWTAWTMVPDNALRSLRSSHTFLCKINTLRGRKKRKKEKRVKWRSSNIFHCEIIT